MHCTTEDTVTPLLHLLPAAHRLHPDPLTTPLPSTETSVNAPPGQGLKNHVENTPPTNCIPPTNSSHHLCSVCSHLIAATTRPSNSKNGPNTPTHQTSPRLPFGTHVPRAAQEAWAYLLGSPTGTRRQTEQQTLLQRQASAAINGLYGSPCDRTNANATPTPPRADDSPKRDARAAAWRKRDNCPRHAPPCSTNLWPPTQGQRPRTCTNTNQLHAKRTGPG